MNLKEKVGQLFFFGFQGTSPSKAIAGFIKNNPIGGVILFKRNLKDPSQIVRLTNTLQSFSRSLPLFVAVDEEGGRVSRLPRHFTRFPSAATIGAIRSTEMAYRAAECTARELRSVGINMNFAPVLDIRTEPRNEVIGDRAFGSDPTAVSGMGLAVLAALQDNRVVACGKHFPGHGDTTADSHKELPLVDQPVSRLRTVELRPFQHAIENGLAALMTAHVLYPELDKEWPATLSRRILTELLRQEMGFNGVVLTDDLEMEAIRLEPGEAAVRALEAGADGILFCHDAEKQRAALEAVHRAVQKKRLTEERIDRSVLRLLDLKDRFLLPHEPAQPAEAKAVVGRPSHKRLLDEILDQAASLNRRRPSHPAQSG
jgi:beta-N-acetylhexosaminidase